MSRQVLGLTLSRDEKTRAADTIPKSTGSVSFVDAQH